MDKSKKLASARERRSRLFRQIYCDGESRAVRWAKTRLAFS